MGIAAAAWWLLVPVAAAGQDSPRWFSGGLFGVSTLSGDARHEASPEAAVVSLYTPESGLAANLFVGAHLTDYVTIQANYISNRNGLTLFSTATSGGVASIVEQSRTSAQHAVVGDFLLYFRQRRDRMRVYLSVGGGLVAVTSTSRGGGIAVGAPAPAPSFSSVDPVVRVAVGMDVKAGGGWSVRYSFSESVSGNPFSRRLSPPASRHLMNFQNLVGLIRAF